MVVWRNLSLLVAGFLTSAILLFGLMAPAVSAQDTQQIINNGLCAGSNLQLGDGNCQQINQTGLDQVNKIVHAIITTLSLVVGIVAVIMIIVGGLRYVTSGGSESSVTSAKNTILYAIIGLVIVALSQVMVHFVLNKVTS